MPLPPSVTSTFPGNVEGTLKVEGLRGDLKHQQNSLGALQYVVLHACRLRGNLLTQVKVIPFSLFRECWDNL